MTSLCTAHYVICAKKKTREKDGVGIVTFDLTGLLATNHIIAYITMAYRSLWGNVRLLTIKLLKQRKIFEISLSDSRIYKKWQTSAITREISDSNLETGRNGSKSQVKSPGLSGRVNSPDVRYNFDLRSHVIAKHGTGSDEIAQWIAGRWQNNRLCQTNMSRGWYI